MGGELEPKNFRLDVVVLPFRDRRDALCPILTLSVGGAEAKARSGSRSGGTFRGHQGGDPTVAPNFCIR